ncbi:MAG: TetR family transcriptional regulator [Methylophilaceae bacterium]|nr:TetR family transcriptional regulator [Methyloradius sp.]
MVRKTKEDAEVTRLRIIDAAREVFLVRGVSRTTIEQIATQANVTRGAVYWHFNNKTELFEAMREQVFLPLIDLIDDAVLNESTDDPLNSIEQYFCGIIQTLEQSITTQQTYEIMMTKCEYVEELAEVLQQILSTCQNIVRKLETIYARAAAKDLINRNHHPAQLALDTHLFFVGLLNMWIKDTECKYIRDNAIAIIRDHVQMKRK